MITLPRETPTSVDLPKALAGVLVGTAVGDSLGLPMEGLSARRQRRLFAPPLRQRFLGAWGMMSDDTEHTFLVAQSLLESPRDPMAFQRGLARRLRWWLLGLPAGVGLATLRSILKLWFGVSPERSGVWSAGNGPAMRSALLGVHFAYDEERRRSFVQASSAITHRDPRADIAAQAVAETAAWMMQRAGNIEVLLSRFESLSELSEWAALVEKLRAAHASRMSVANFAHSIGAVRGVSGYAFQSVPAAIYAALRHRDDFAGALTEIITCGGDTDTTAAITGALVGARAGIDGIPAEWRSHIIEWPRSLGLLERAAAKLARLPDGSGTPGPVRYAWPLLLLRNLFFLLVVLAHGFRRLLPPY